MPRFHAGKCSSYRNNDLAANAKEYYRRNIFLPLINNMISHLKQQVQKQNNNLGEFSCLNATYNEENVDDLLKLAEFYSKGEPLFLEHRDDLLSELYHLIKREYHIKPASLPLQYTPRQFVINRKYSNAIIIGGDYNSYTKETVGKLKDEIKTILTRRYNSKDSSDIEKMISYLVDDKKWKKWNADGYAGKGASCMYIVDYTKKKIVHKLEFEQDEAALRLCLYIHKEASQKSIKYHILVGVTRNLDLTFNSYSSASIDSYKVVKGWTSLKLLHKNPVNGIPTAICTFKENLLVGIGCELHYFDYDFEKGTLKLKCKIKCVPDRIHSIYLVDDIIMVANAEGGIYYLMYDMKKNHFCRVGKSKTMTLLSAACILGEKLVARACKSGNISIVQLHIIENTEKPNVKSPANVSVVSF
ncbi:splicing factor 3B subunit 3 [Trichonephila clavipes]|nr:splicing factor 3B subunit 3 [Trichonephila clavipes]